MCNITLMETIKSQKRVQKEFKRFVRKSFIKPRNCRNIDQTRFYIFELHKKMKELKLVYGYVPDEAHLLSTEYQNVQDRMLFQNFQTTSAPLLC